MLRTLEIRHYGPVCDVSEMGLYSWNNCKHTVCEHILTSVYVQLGLHVVVMITGNDLSKGIFAIDVLTAIKFSLEHSRKHC